MLSEPFLDVLVLACLLGTAFAWANVVGSVRRTPAKWIGPQEEFDRRVKGETRWSRIGWLFIGAGSLIAAVDLYAA